MRHRLLRLAAIAVTAAGCLSASPATAATGAGAAPAATTCRTGYFCLWEGPHQTGRLLFAESAHVTASGFRFPYREDIEPPIFPQSVRNPLPDEAGCIVRLNDQPDFAGDEQEVSGMGDHELDGRRVASMTEDCG